MFRYTNDCSEMPLLPRALKVKRGIFKMLEYTAALLSLAMLVVVVVLQYMENVDLRVSQHDRVAYKRWWVAEGTSALQYGIHTGTALPSWDEKYHTDENRIIDWMWNEDHHGVRTEENARFPTDSDSANREILRRLKEELKRWTTNTYPGTVWFHDTTALLFDADSYEKSVDEFKTSQDESTCQNLDTSSTPTDVTNCGLAIISTSPDSDLLKYWQPAQALMAMQTFDSIVGQTCSRTDIHEVQEGWGKIIFRGTYIAQNSYKVNLWGLIAVIHACSLLFQFSRAFTYSSYFRPDRPDLGRWVEYFITSPLMIVIIASSAMIRDVSMILLLLFLQAALIVLGYMLELLMETWIDAQKATLFARKWGTYKITCHGQRPTLRVNIGSESQTQQITEYESRQKAEHNRQGLIDKFLELRENPTRETADGVMQASVELDKQYGWVVNVTFFFAFMLWGVIWTVIVARLIHQTVLANSCSGGRANEGVPIIVWFIVTGQVVCFALFGVNSAVMWQMRLSDLNKDLSGEPSEIQTLTGEQDDEIFRMRQNAAAAWVDTAFVYSILNIISKLYLEVTILIYAMMTHSY